jgi:hypothetical protein
MEDASMSEDNRMWAFKCKWILKRLLIESEVDETEL